MAAHMSLHPLHRKIHDDRIHATSHEVAVASPDANANATVSQEVAKETGTGNELLAAAKGAVREAMAAMQVFGAKLQRILAAEGDTIIMAKHAATSTTATTVNLLEMTAWYVSVASTKGGKAQKPFAKNVPSSSIAASASVDCAALVFLQ